MEIQSAPERPGTIRDARGVKAPSYGTGVDRAVQSWDKSFEIGQGGTP